MFLSQDQWGSTERQIKQAAACSQLYFEEPWRKKWNEKSESRLEDRQERIIAIPSIVPISETLMTLLSIIF